MAVSTFEKMLNKISSLIEKGDLGQAETNCRKLLDRVAKRKLSLSTAEQINLYDILSGILEQKGDTGGAIESHKQSLGIDSNNPVMLRKLCKLYRGREHLTNEEMTYFERALRLGISAPEDVIKLGEALRCPQCGDGSERLDHKAMLIYKLIFEKYNPLDEKNKIALAKAYILHGYEGIEVYELYRSIGIDYIDLIYYVGRACANKGYYDVALKAFDMVILNEEGSYLMSSSMANYKVLAHLRRGDIFFKSTANRDIAKALHEYMGALRLDSQCLEAYFNLGEIYSSPGEFRDSEKAIEYYEKVIEINPNILDAHKRLADIFLDEKNFHSAIVHYKKVLEHDSENENVKKQLVSLHMELGGYYRRSGDKARARKEYEKVLALDRYNLEAQQRLLEVSKIGMESSPYHYREVGVFPFETTKVATSFVVKYRVLSTNPQTSGVAETFDARANELSVDGIKLELSQRNAAKVAESAMLSIEFMLTTSHLPVKVIGKVVKNEQAARAMGNMVEVTVVFTEILEADKRKIFDYIEMRNRGL